MKQSSSIKIRRLSKDFHRDIYQDAVKRCIVPGKWLLQSLLLWPDTKSKFVRILNWLILINIITVEIFHASYVIGYKGDVGDTIVASATVITTFEGLFRYYIIFINYHGLNSILYKIWKQFWPVACVTVRKMGKITTECYIMVGLQFGCLGPSIISSAFITLWPVLSNKGLIFKSSYPFQWNQTCVYEVLYMWQYATHWYLLFLVNGYDVFLIAVIAICACQFMILQSVFKNMLSEKSKSHRLILFGKHISDRDMLLKCLDQQRLLIGICNEMEKIFNFSILMQFSVCISALCSSCVILKINSKHLSEMLTYAVAHMFQLFYYCYAGNELTLQSLNIADAIYRCNWHLSDNLDFKRSLTLMIQRSQKAQALTAAGVTELNLLSYIKVVKITFSFYTLLSTLIDRKINAV